MREESGLQETTTHHRTRERGATATEYALMVSAVAIAIILAVTGLGAKISSSFVSAAGSLFSEDSTETEAVVTTAPPTTMSYAQWCASLGGPYHLNGSGVCVRTN